MIDFSDKTYANILAGQLARVTNSLDKREGSVIQTSLGPESWTLEDFYITLRQIQENGYGPTSVGDALDLKAAERSLSRRMATYTQREGVFNVPIPIGARFSTINGANSLTFSVTDQPLPGSTPFGLQYDGYYHYNLICETSGTAGNEYAGTLLPITFVTGLTYAEITTIIIAGSDEEDDDSLKQRYLLALQEQPFGGNMSSYRSFLLAHDKIGAVQIYPVWQGAGTVLCSILDANYDVATPALIDEIQAVVCPPDAGDTTPSANGYGIAPIGAEATVGTATELTIDVETTVLLASGYSIPGVQTSIEAAISLYIQSVRRTWGKPVITNKVEYPLYVYTSRIISAIITVEGVVNAKATTLNGSGDDICCVETGVLQEIPALGAVIIHEG